MKMRKTLETFHSHSELERSMISVRLIQRSVFKLNREIDIKGGAFTGLPDGRNKPLVVLHNFFANSQPDAGAGIFCFSVKALKDLEDLMLILLFKANSIITHTQLPIV